MSNTELDKGVALEILRRTTKTAAAPAVGIGGPPAQEPGPLVPGGGGALGGSNNTQMQTGWAAGAMRKSLIKKFTANAAKQQGQSVNVAASKQVGGMGSGMPKMAAIGARLEKQAGAKKWVLKGFKEGAPRIKELLKKYRKFSTPKTPDSPTKVMSESLDDIISRGELSVPKKAVEAGADALRQTLPVPKGFKAYAEPGKRHIANPRGWLTRGEGLSNIYKSKDTGQLVIGSKGAGKGPIRDFIGKGRGPAFLRQSPPGFDLAKGFTHTGGAIPSGVKKSLYRGTGFYGAGLGAGNLLNPKSSMFDSKRQRLAVGMAALPSLATVPGAGLAATSDSYKNLMLKGYAGGAGLGRSEGGVFAGKARNPLEVGEEIQRRRIKRLDKDRVALIQAEIKKAGDGKLSQEAINRVYDFDKKVGYIKPGPIPMKSARNPVRDYSRSGRRRNVRGYLKSRGGNIMDFKAPALPGEPGYRRPARGVRTEESLRDMLRDPLGATRPKKPGSTLQRHLRRDIYRTADPRTIGY